MPKIQIAIDGPVASGKSTISQIIARKLNLTFINSGLIYRAVAYYFISNNLNYNQNDILIIHLAKITITFNNQKILLNGFPLGEELRTEIISYHSSKIAALALVRQKFLKIQQNIAQKGDVIIDGRDIGTVVLPHADFKFFLISDINIRAKRRYQENVIKGIKQSLTKIIVALKERDHLDITRKISPLIKAKDAIEINTSYLSIEKVINKILSIIKG